MAKSCHATTSWRMPIGQPFIPPRRNTCLSPRTRFIMCFRRMCWLRRCLRTRHVRLSVCCWSVCIRVGRKARERMERWAAFWLRCRNRIGFWNRINPSWDTYNGVQWLFINTTTPKRAPSTSNSTTKTWTALKSSSKKATKPAPPPQAMTSQPMTTR